MFRPLPAALVLVAVVADDEVAETEPTSHQSRAAELQRRPQRLQGRKHRQRTTMRGVRASRATTTHTTMSQRKRSNAPPRARALAARVATPQAKTRREEKSLRPEVVEDHREEDGSNGVARRGQGRGGADLRTPGRLLSRAQCNQAVVSCVI